jgi:hypothetical protein
LTTNPTMTAGPPAARSLHEICEDARRANCGVCWALPGDECVFTTAPASVPVTRDTAMLSLRGYHVGRFGRAMRRGLISGPDLVAVLQAAVVFTLSTVIYDGDQPAEDADDETCPRCGAVSWGMTPDGLPECTLCLWPDGAL